MISKDLYTTYDTITGDLYCHGNHQIQHDLPSRAFGALFGRPAIPAEGDPKSPTSLYSYQNPAMWPAPEKFLRIPMQIRIELMHRYALVSESASQTGLMRAKSHRRVKGPNVHMDEYRIRVATIVAALTHNDPSLIGDPRIIFHPTLGHLILPPSGWHPVETDHGWKPVHLPFV